MRDKSSFRICSRQGDEMSASIAAEMEAIAKRAAEPVRAGETVKGQMRRAATRLQVADWRVRAAWYGEAGCWSARAVEEFRMRAVRLNWKLREEGRAELQRLRAEMARLVERYERPDPDFGRPHADLVRDQLRRLDRENGPPDCT